jgi:hypothetical protein
MNDIYCMYFDHNYLSRAVVDIETLRQFDATPIYVLALSNLCSEILHVLDLPNVNIIPLATLERAYPELSAIKPTRKLIEYYFTLTPFLPHYLFAKTTADRVSYMDGDLYFFASPKRVLDSLNEASVAITPHRFSLPYRNHIVYGRFNVGWITFRRCEEGLACLDAYKADCLAWCYDRLEDGRFGDQKYLDAWPDRYPALKIIDHKGFNLAIWNIQNYLMRMKNGVFTVDDDPLIFYHCASTSVQDDGSVSVLMPQYESRSMKLLVEHVLNPYVRILQRRRRELLTRFPALTGNERAIRYPPQNSGV